MFDLITGKTKHMPSGGPVTVLLSTALHVVVLSAVLIVPLLFVTDVVPNVPTMLAFVATPPPEPPPPPPPPPPARATDSQPQGTTSSLNAAPVEAPSKIEPEPTGPETGEDETIGGVEGGIPGGVVGGVVGGLVAVSLPPPPPPPPPPAPREPVRIGGEIHPPVLVHRVEPIYPDLALSARIEGMVILEAIIEEDGNVSNVKVLSAPKLLDKAAVAAVEQWRYAPVMLNGRPVRCILTVSVSFRIPPA